MNSKTLFERAKQVIPGGVNSPVRAFNAVGGDPVYVSRGSGSRIWTVEGRELTDFCGSWGPLILGHARLEVVAAIAAAARDGTSFGINTPVEVEFAEFIRGAIPSVEMVRAVSSGTEAVMTGLRVARGYTGRQKVIKFDGCYHGHADYLLVAAGSGLLTGGISASAGVSAAATADILVAPYNDVDAVNRIVASHGAALAAIIVEPVAGNMGLVPPEPGFLEGLRRAADSCGAALIFDEVITGFRLGPTGFSSICGVRPDLTCLGKIVGGGMPIGAVGGRGDLMRTLAPLGPVYQAGTLSGNPVALAAGLTTLRLLKTEKPYGRMEEHAKRLAAEITNCARKRNVAMHVASMGGMFTPFFTDAKVRDLASAKKSDTKRYAAFFQGMLARGFYLPPSQFEVAFVSSAHTEEDISRFIAAACDTL
jgi:glutamate-1-semialdehyde 2,1-aminomutase